MFKCMTATVALALTGCASVTNDKWHAIKVETKDETGELVAGADCKLTNDRITVSGKSGDSIDMRRSSRDLLITCLHPSNPEASARAISRANAGMWGNIIIGGAVGAIVDHNVGTAYTYPTWVQLEFGKKLVFDRRAQKEGAPTPSTDLAAGQPANAPAVAASGTQSK